MAVGFRDKESDMTESNPLLVEGDFPLFDQIRHDHVVPAVTQVLASNQASLDMLKQRSPDEVCLLYTSPSPRDLSTSRMPSSA